MLWRASFYELDSEGRILYARDLVEPALKPGSSALLVGLESMARFSRMLCLRHAVAHMLPAAQGLKLLAPIVRKLGPRANPAMLKELPTRAIAVWLFYAGTSTLSWLACRLFSVNSA